MLRCSLFSILRRAQRQRIHSAVVGRRHEIDARLNHFHVIRLEEREQEARENKLRRMSKRAREAAITEMTSGTPGGGEPPAPANGASMRRHRSSSVPASAGDRATSGDEDGGCNGGVATPNGNGDGDEDDSDDETVADADENGEGGETHRRAAEAPQFGGQEPTADNWWAYAYHSRCGLRRFLGADAVGRHYWLFAGRAGAFQVSLPARSANSLVLSRSRAEFGFNCCRSLLVNTVLRTLFCAMQPE
jgi:hypothetical protein